jgi:FkbM family methyltransferase
MTAQDQATDFPNREELIASGRVIEAETDLGPLLLERDAELLTPGVLEFGTWATDIGNLMRRYLKPGMTVVDAGANIGYMSVLASQLVGPVGKVFSVEVDPGNQPILRENLRHLGRDNWEILPIAAWHEESLLNLFPNDSGGAGTFVAETDEPGEGQVRAAPLGEVIDADVDYMKVDCENTDHFVVKGAEKLFRRNPSMLITVEFNPDFTGHTEVGPSEILDLYRELGLSPYAILDSGKVKATDYETLRASGGAEDDSILYDFALCAGRPPRPRFDAKLMGGHARDAVLRAGGNMLEYIPEPIRPKIRHRDRNPQ